MGCKKIIFCFWMLACAFKCLAIDDTTVHKYNPLWTRYIYSSDILFSDFNRTMDTSLDFLEMYDPMIHKFEYAHPQFFNTNLGNLGSASFSLEGFSIHANEFHIGIDAYSLYDFTPESVKFYDTKKPFTDLKYVQGLYNEQLLEVTHSQNISENWNVGFDIRKTGSKGIYQFEKTNLGNVAIGSWVHSKNRCYNNFITVCYNHYKIENNGGVTNDNVLTDSLIINKSLADVGRDSSRTENFTNVICMINSYTFGDSTIENEFDSSLVWKSKFYLQHEIKYERGAYHYHDAGDDLTHYQNLFIDSNETNDSLLYSLIQNEIYFDHSLNYMSAFGSSLKLQQQVWHLSGWQTDTSFQKYPIQAEIRLNPSKSYVLPHFTFHYQTDLLNQIFKSHVFNVNVMIPWIGSFLYYSNGTTSPSFLENHFSGNEYRWDNHFNLEHWRSWNVGSYDYKRLSLNFYWSKVSNYLYWDQFGKPNQYVESLNIFKAKLWKKTVMKNFHWNMALQYQYTSNNSILSLPTFLVFNQVYLEKDYFNKALYSQIGIDVSYFTDYFAPAFNVETMHFYNQGNLLVQKYYPVVDVFANLKIRSARVFLKIGNATQPFMKSKGYFSALHYPMPDASFKFGIDWMMWN